MLNSYFCCSNLAPPQPGLIRYAPRKDALHSEADVSQNTSNVARAMGILNFLGRT